MKDEEIDSFIEEHKELFDGLANSLLCPGCKKVVRSPFYNLGEKFSWAEGCKMCYDEQQEKEK